MFGKDAPSLRDVTFDSLVRSSALRGKILDYTKIHYQQVTNPLNSFEKQHRNEDHAKLDESQSFQLSSLKNEMK